MAKSRPTEGLELAHEMLRTGDRRARLIGSWAAGRALFELARNEEAIGFLQDACDLAKGTDLRREVEVSLAAALHAGGQTEEAIEILRAITEEADGDDEALARSQLGFIQMTVGEMTEARSLLTESIPRLVASARHGDAAARAVGNLAFCDMTLGNLTAAIDTCRFGVELGRQHGEQVVVAGCLQNLGCLEQRHGHLPAALRRLHDAEKAYAELRNPSRNLASLHDDLAETYRLAGLPLDATHHAAYALRLVADGGNVERLAESQYQLALCLLSAGQVDDALSMASEAAEQFEAAGRTVHTHRARLLGLEGLDPGDQRAEPLLAQVPEACGTLETTGWRTEALAIRNRAAYLLVGTGRDAELAELLGSAMPTSTESVVGLLERHLHDILWRLAFGEELTPALEAARRTVVRHQVRLHDPELRAGVARLCERFRHLALLGAFAEPDGRSLIEAEESWRAMSFNLPRTEPPPGDELAATSLAVREASARVDRDGPPDPVEAARVRRLEERLRRLSLQVTPAVRQPGQVRSFDLGHLRDRLAGRTFVLWLTHRGDLYGVRVDGRSTTWWECGPAADITRAAAVIDAELARLLRPGLTPERQEIRWKLIESESTALGRRLLPTLSPGELVLSPPPPLLALPWPLLVGDLSVPITLTPSASAWLSRAPTRIPARAGVVVGPGIPGGRADAEAIERAVEDTVVASGPEATGARLAELMGDRSILHVAAHGRFRPDGPTFSSLLLHDGPFGLYDLQSMPVPELVVLAVCDAGRSEPLPGGELLGMAPAWFHGHATTVVAAGHSIVDSDAAAVTSGFYQLLPGRTPASALAQLRHQHLGSPRARLATVTAFTCFGGDCGRVSPGRVHPSVRYGNADRRPFGHRDDGRATCDDTNHL
jgi:tetratricopeptide (TPR) repeat protein